MEKTAFKNKLHNNHSEPEFEEIRAAMKNYVQQLTSTD